MKTVIVTFTDTRNIRVFASLRAMCDHHGWDYHRVYNVHRRDLNAIAHFEGVFFQRQTIIK